MKEFKLWENAPEVINEVPVLHYYPALRKTTTATCVIYPGGGYAMRAPHEGEGYAQIFNALGMDAFVCEYRCAPSHFPIELLDARRAVRYVRAHAAEFNIDPDRVAVMGSSAGGHLAAFVSTYTAPIEKYETDEIDAINPIPNATILCYPVIHYPDESKIAHEGSYINLVGAENAEKYPLYSPDLLVNETTPKAFIWHTSDDDCVNVINSYRYAEALRKQGIKHEMHIFPDGPHGLGTAGERPHVHQWVTLLGNWLAYNGWNK